MSRVLKVLAAAALVGAGCLTATPAQAVCFTFTDPAGDTEIVQAGVPDAEPDLDLVGAEYLTTTSAVGARVQVAALGTTPAKAPGDVFQMGFTLAGFYFDFYVERLAGTVVQGSSDPSGITVTGTVDTATNSVTILASRADLEAATGVSTNNAQLTDLNAGAYADYGTWLLYDEAFPAGSASYQVGSSCH